MGRLKREYYVRATYHVYNRGNNRLKVLADDSDKKVFLKLLDSYRKRFNFLILAICLMNNHYHLIVQTNQIHSISRIMHAVLISFSFRYRKKHKYVGHLWQSRFKSRVIEDEKDFSDCLSYIHNNPVKARLVNRADDYLFSSANAFERTAFKVGEVLEVDLLTRFNRAGAALHS